MGDEIYQDKIGFSATMVEKELKIITGFHDLLYNIRLRKDLKEFLFEYPPFLDVWRNCGELYDVLSGQYLDKLNKEDKEKIILIMAKYINGVTLGLDELKEVRRIILIIMTKAGFHDVLRKEEMKGLKKITERYKLKEGE